MKTAVSIPDEIFKEADALAEKLGKSRSELYREALVDYLARRDPASITAALDAVADELAAEHTGFGRHAAAAVLSSSEW
jgi:metal-responsive CopG/Arc/MetJ family transcriptional regulator